MASDKFHRDCYVLVVFSMLLSSCTGTTIQALKFNGSSIFDKPASWRNPTVPGTLEILNCNKSHITVQTDPQCCSEIVLIDTFCDACTAQGRKECLMTSQSTNFMFTKEMDGICGNKTDFEIQCLELACLEGVCPTDSSSSTVTVNMINHQSTGTSTPAVTSETPIIASTDIKVTSVTKTPGPTSAISHTTDISTNSSPASEVTSIFSTVTETIVTTYENSSNITLNDTSTESPFDLEESKKDMYTFLAALGAALLLIMIIVCAFFIRKSRTKVPIVDISDEFWHNKDYITDPIEGNFCPGASYNVTSPVYNSKSYTARNTYLKNEETVPPSFVKTETFRPSYTSHAQQIESAYQMEPVAGHLSERERIYSTDDEAGVVMDLTTMVTNEIKMQQRKHDSGDDRTFSEGAANDTSQPSLSGQYRKGKRHRESRQRMRSGQRTSKDSVTRNGEIDQRIKSSDIYSVAYKNRFHEYLDQCSAEESDV